MSVTITVRPFRLGTDKDAARKVVEEAAEAFSAWEGRDFCGSPSRQCGRCVDSEKCDIYERIADEIADCVTACVNLADRYHIDLQAALDRVEERNRERGRYGC